MRWLKHMTATRQDEKIAAYLELAGPKRRHEAYGFYWALLEIVASQMETGSSHCSVTYPLTLWSRMLYCHHHTVGKYIGNLEVTHLVTAEWADSNLRVTIPKLLKDRDEYSKKSGQNEPRVRKKQIQIQNIETEGTPVMTPALDEQFQNFKALYEIVGNPIEEDFANGSFCWRAWCLLDYEQRSVVVASLRDRQASGVSVLHKPDNYLTKSEYKRKIKAHTNGTRKRTLAEELAE